MRETDILQLQKENNILSHRILKLVTAVGFKCCAGQRDTTYRSCYGSWYTKEVISLVVKFLII